MPLRLKFMNICTRRQITMFENSDPKRFANAISDNRVDLTQKSNIDIDICFQLKNQPNKFNLKVLFLKVKSVQDQMSLQSLIKSQGLETYFNMHKYTELLIYLTKIRISEYKDIQGIELHGGQFAYRPRSNRDFSQSF